MTIKLTDSEIVELLEKVKRKTIYQDGHWLYGGGLSSGYGRVWNKTNKIKILVHRLSAHIYHHLDLFDYTKDALHKTTCTFKSCWNPEHIYVGTPSDNMEDRVSLINRVTHCKRGHEYTSFNTYITKDGRRQCNTCCRMRQTPHKNLVGVE